MKYIRTKNGVYEIIRYYEPNDYYWVKQDCEQPIGSNEVINKSDDIEDLCDGYIFKDTRANELHIAQKGKEDGIFILGASLFTETLRYFIETDNGLIYVAKMNDKGELCLL